MTLICQFLILTLLPKFGRTHSYKFIGVIFAICIVFSTHKSWAVEPLQYTVHFPSSLLLELPSNIKKEEYKLARIDLNGDGDDEYLLSPILCEVTCRHKILAYRKNKLIQIAEITARNIMLGGSYTHGIKDILAFDSEINDYNFVIYIWSPAEKMYILKGD